MNRRLFERLLIIALFASCGGASGSSPDSGAGGIPAAIEVSATARTPRASSWSLGYWTWAPSYGAPVAGTEALIAALAPPLIRIGCYNNDANVPDPFDHAELDKAAAYARAVGAELLLQVPLLATSTGARPTGADVAEMVSYANVTKGYAIRYVSIGNEPDLYPDQGGLMNPIHRRCLATRRPSTARKCARWRLRSSAGGRRATVGGDCRAADLTAAAARAAGA